ncbi:hypothetical protein Tco_0001199 [Tanacetum coccineum]
MVSVIRHIRITTTIGFLLEADLPPRKRARFSPPPFNIGESSAAAYERLPGSTFYMLLLTESWSPYFYEETKREFTDIVMLSKIAMRCSCSPVAHDHDSVSICILQQKRLKIAHSAPGSLGALSESEELVESASSKRVKRQGMAPDNG